MEGNHQEHRQMYLDFLEKEPQVPLLGFGTASINVPKNKCTESNLGQVGLNTSARLQTFGMSCLMVDKNSRIDSN